MSSSRASLCSLSPPNLAASSPWLLPAFSLKHGDRLRSRRPLRLESINMLLVNKGGQNTWGWKKHLSKWRKMLISTTLRYSHAYNVYCKAPFFSLNYWCSQPAGFFWWLIEWKSHTWLFCAHNIQQICEWETLLFSWCGEGWGAPGQYVCCKTDNPHPLQVSILLDRGIMLCTCCYIYCHLFLLRCDRCSGSRLPFNRYTPLTVPWHPNLTGGAFQRPVSKLKCLSKAWL